MSVEISQGEMWKRARSSSKIYCRFQKQRKVKQEA